DVAKIVGEISDFVPALYSHHSRRPSASLETHPITSTVIQQFCEFITAGRRLFWHNAEDLTVYPDQDRRLRLDKRRPRPGGRPGSIARWVRVGGWDTPSGAVAPPTLCGPFCSGHRERICSRNLAASGYLPELFTP